MKLSDIIRRDGSKGLKDELKQRKRKSNPANSNHPVDQVEGDGDGDMSDQAFDWGPETFV